jgi:hypothetical protein
MAALGLPSNFKKMKIAAIEPDLIKAEASVPDEMR